MIDLLSLSISFFSNKRACSSSFFFCSSNLSLSKLDILSPGSFLPFTSAWRALIFLSWICDYALYLFLFFGAPYFFGWYGYLRRSPVATRSMSSRTKAVSRIGSKSLSSVLESWYSYVAILRSADRSDYRSKFSCKRCSLLTLCFWTVGRACVDRTYESIRRSGASGASLLALCRFSETMSLSCFLLFFSTMLRILLVLYF